MEEMMVSRRAVLQSQAEKVSRNWAEESGMRQFVAVSNSPITQRAISKLFGVEPDILRTREARWRPDQAGSSLDSRPTEGNAGRFRTRCTVDGRGLRSCAGVSDGGWECGKPDIHGRKRCGPSAIFSIHGIPHAVTGRSFGVVKGEETESHVR